MFTGLIRTVNPILRTELIEDGRRLLVEYQQGDFEDHGLSMGSSVSVNGVCLTVSRFESGGIRMDVSEETLEKTTFSTLEDGDLVNLEPSLCVGDELGGHFVFGHVDTTVSVDELDERGDFYNLAVTVPEKFRPYVTSKGSVALDGISLTVNRCNGEKIYIRIIPHTFENTRIKELEPGMSMNLEVDMLARYVYTSIRYQEEEVPNLFDR